MGLTSLAVTGFQRPDLGYAYIWPLLVVFGVACAGLLVEAFVPRDRRYLTQLSLTVAALAAALVGTIVVATMNGHPSGAGAGYVPFGNLVGGGALAIDGPGLVLWGLILVVSLAGTLLFAERRLEGGVSVFAGQAAALPGTPAERSASQHGLDHTEVYPLLLFSVGGMMLFPVADNLVLLFVALEVLSLPLYLLTGLARRRRMLSQEAALKYFLLGAFSSAFFLYGLAMVYGYAGSMSLDVVYDHVRTGHGDHALLLLGMGLMAVGLLFKVGAVPFHSWTPDVYQAAPTPVTSWMSAATKVAAFGALLRLFYIAFGADAGSWRPALGIVAIVTMAVGAAVGVVQTDVKRMLAYSAIAHTGFVLTGLVGMSSFYSSSVTFQASRHPGGLTAGFFSVAGGITPVQAVLFYLIAYSCATVGAFAIVSLVRNASGEAGTFAAWAGLGKRSPLVAGSFAVLLFSMAGIPLTGGFIGKWAVFSQALAAGQWPVAAIAIACSIITVFFYVRFVLLMFFTEPVGEAAASQGGPGMVVRPSVATMAVIGAAVVATIGLGVAPGPVLDLIRNAGSFIG